MKNVRRDPKPRQPRPRCFVCSEPIEFGQQQTSSFNGDVEHRYHWPECYEARQLLLPLHDPPTVTPVGNLNDVMAYVGGDS